VDCRNIIVQKNPAAFFVQAVKLLTVERPPEYGADDKDQNDTDRDE